jgi:hypothetical protein
MVRKLFIAGLAILLCACAGAPERIKLGHLNKAINEYGYALRWQRIDDAVSFHKKRDGTSPDIDTSPMEDIRVTGFSIDKRILNQDQTEAVVTGELTYYKEDYGTLKKLQFEQHWWYDPEAKRWYLESDFPNFK